MAKRERKVQVYITDETKEKLETIAEKQDRSLSYVASQIIEKALHEEDDEEEKNKDTKESTEKRKWQTQTKNPTWWCRALGENFILSKSIVRVS